MKSSAEILPGTLDMLILRVLARESLHGYGIAQRLRDLSEDVLQVGESSLYPALQRLLLNDYVEAEWAASENNRRARYYRLTPRAEEAPRRRAHRLRSLRDGHPPGPPTGVIYAGTLFRRLRARLRYRRFDRDLAEELAFHRDMKQTELATDSADAADRPERTSAVDRSMGNELLMRERARDVWVPPSLDALRQDLRDACRLLVRRPLFTVASVAALVVGVGAATLACSLAQRLLLRPLRSDRPDELVYLSAPSFSHPILAGGARARFLPDRRVRLDVQAGPARTWNGAERSLVLLGDWQHLPGARRWTRPPDAC